MRPGPFQSRQPTGGQGGREVITYRLWLTKEASRRAGGRKARVIFSLVIGDRQARPFPTKTNHTGTKSPHTHFPSAGWPPPLPAPRQLSLLPWLCLIPCLRVTHCSPSARDFPGFSAEGPMAKEASRTPRTGTVGHLTQPPPTAAPAALGAPSLAQDTLVSSWVL